MISNPEFISVKLREEIKILHHIQISVVTNVAQFNIEEFQFLQYSGLHIDQSTLKLPQLDM